ncbi:hypothetical protein [Mycolicibacterium arenosum]|uniref:Intersectin-EH binding protein Ibp1 n=1 Tax=Mycolicibacterium arenosum TaxID=2952157 RepID=A0ABT1LXQ4_9MYCO|nr:hypothetical protein [Mycolicibacterium sp. CAU 1645]MCP9271678.1 hypothetical protein [Mycolicibacterium sp. CAU 1645]
MRLASRSLLLIPAAVGAAVLMAPVAGAEPTPGLPQCVDTGGAAAEGGSNTECATPGNVEINSTPAEGEFTGPWGNMWGEPGLFFP